MTTVLDSRLRGNDGFLFAGAADAPERSIKRYNITAAEADMNAIDAYLKRSEKTRDRSSFLIQCALNSIRMEKKPGGTQGGRRSCSGAHRPCRRLQ